MQSTYINPGNYVDIENICGLFILVCRYSSETPAIYIVSTKGGLSVKLVDAGPNLVSLVDGKLRITNSYNVQIDVQYCYQNIGR